jgi:hypothetical protein
MGDEGSSLSFALELRAAHPTPSVPPMDNCLGINGLASLGVGLGVAVEDAARRRRAVERMFAGLKRGEVEGMVGERMVGDCDTKEVRCWSIDEDEGDIAWLEVYCSVIGV